LCNSYLFLQLLSRTKDFRNNCFAAQLYVWELCYNEKWNRPKTGAVIAWREPIAFGHRRLLIGDANDFQEFCFEYYGITLDLNSCSKLRNAKENEAELSKVSEGHSMLTP
jgi:hypothetical protein